MLEHMVLICEGVEKEVTNEDIEEEGEISCNLVLVECQVCACEEVRNYILGYKLERNLCEVFFKCNDVADNFNGFGRSFDMK